MFMQRELNSGPGIYLEQEIPRILINDKIRRRTVESETVPMNSMFLLVQFLGNQSLLRPS
jgi:hypothetical protein